MDYTAQQWQWFLQQSQHQKQRPQTMHWRQPYAGAATGGDNWWADEAAQAWSAASEAAFRSNPLLAGRRQIHQHTNYRNVPWFRKQEADTQSATAAAENTSPEGGQPRSGDPGLGHPPSEAAAEQAHNNTAVPEPPNPLAHLPLAIQRLAKAASPLAPCPPPPLPQPLPAPPCLPPVAPFLPSTPSPGAKTGRQAQQTTSTSPCYYDRRCTRINCWHQHPNGRNMDDQKVRSRTPRRSKSRSTHRKSPTVQIGRAHV